jgi:hypothetical protein
VVARSGLSVGGPQAALSVKMPSSVCERCTRILWHVEVDESEPALP